MTTAVFLITITIMGYESDRRVVNVVLKLAVVSNLLLQDGGDQPGGRKAGSGQQRGCYG